MKRMLPAMLIFCCTVVLGFWVAVHKPMWNDEYYSTVSSIQQMNYVDMFKGKIPEGNNTPLYYLLQKILIDVTPYAVPTEWIDGKWTDNNVINRFFLRINPVVFMSLSMTLIFHFFWYRANWLMAFLSLMIFSSTQMLWPFWAEARPYALLVFLTTLQSLCFINIIDSQGKCGWKRLSLVQILLAFTSIFSLGLVAVTAVLLYQYRSQNLKQYLLCLIIPLSVVLFFYAHAPRYPFHFDLTPEQLIRDNIGRERFYIFFAFIVFWFYQHIDKSFAALKEVLPYFKFLLGAIIVTILFIMMFKSGAKAKGVGFPVTSRYFIYLIPIGVIAAVWSSFWMSRVLGKWRLMQFGFWVAVMCLVVPKFIKIAIKSVQSYIG